MWRLQAGDIPAQDGSLVPRRLKRRLQESYARRLVTAVGCPGSGKTTLLGWFASWLRAEKDAFVVWAGVVEDSQPGALVVDEALSQWLSRDLLPDGTRMLYLFIDDADLIDGEPEVEAMHAALSSARPNAHFVLSGRGHFPLNISRLRLNRDILEIRQEDLMLRLDEFAGEMSRAHGLAPRDSKKLYDLVAGLPVGVRMCSLLLDEGAGADEIARRFSHANLMSSDFFMEEVVSGLSDADLDFMCRMSVFPSFEIALAHACSETPACEEHLAHLLENGVLVGAPDEELEVASRYQFRPLFYPCVKWLARTRVSPEQAASIAACGVDWLERDERPLEAVRLALANGLYQEAFGLLNRHFYTVLVNCDIDELGLLLRRVVCSDATQRACQSLAVAWVMFCQGKSRRASVWLGRYESALDSGGVETVFKGTAQIYRTISLGIDVFEGRYDEALSLGSELLGETGGPQLFLRATVMHNMGEAYERIGRYGEAYESFTKARATAGLSGRREVVALCDCEVTWLYFIRGELDAASNVALRAIADAGDGKDASSWSVGVLNVAMARIYLQWGEFDRAHVYLDRALASSFSSERNRDGYFEAKVTLARCLAGEGRLEEASEILAGAYEMALMDRVPRGVDLLVYVSYAECLVDVGRPDFATRVLQELEGRLDSRDVFYRVHADLAWARVMALSGNFGDAEFLLRASLGRARDAELGLLATDCSIRLACLLRERGDEDESRALMAEALAQAASENRVYPFRERSAVQEGLLRELAYPEGSNRVLREQEKTARAYARTLLELADEQEPHDGAEPACDDGGQAELSEREREIWALLRQGKTRREISEALGIKVNTVRTHVRNIYRKLGIHSRAEL